MEEPIKLPALLALRLAVDQKHALLTFFKSKDNFNKFMSQALQLNPIELLKLANILNVEGNAFGCINAALDWLPVTSRMYLRLFFNQGGKYRELLRDKLFNEMQEKMVLINQLLNVNQLPKHMEEVLLTLLSKFENTDYHLLQSHKPLAWLTCFYFDDFFQNNFEKKVGGQTEFVCPLLVRKHKRTPRNFPSAEFEINDIFLVAFFYAANYCYLVESILPDDPNVTKERSFANDAERRVFFFSSVRPFFINVSYMKSVKITLEEMIDSEKLRPNLDLDKTNADRVVLVRNTLDGNIHALIHKTLQDSLNYFEKNNSPSSALPAFLVLDYSNVTSALHFRPFKTIRRYIMIYASAQE